MENEFQVGTRRWLHKLVTKIPGDIGGIQALGLHFLGNSKPAEGIEVVTVEAPGRQLHFTEPRRVYLAVAWRTNEAGGSLTLFDGDTEGAEGIEGLTFFNKSDESAVLYFPQGSPFVNGVQTTAEGSVEGFVIVGAPPAAQD